MNHRIWIAGALLLSLPIQSAQAAGALDHCEYTVYWSKKSSASSLVFKDSGDKVEILNCSLKMVEGKNSEGKATAHREYASCAPLDPGHPFYTQKELNKDYWFLFKDMAKNRSKRLAADLIGGFLVTVFAVPVGQKLAGAVSKVGTQAVSVASRLGTEAPKAVEEAARVLGAGQDIIEGSKLVSKDPYLRFFPAYIGAGSSLAWNNINDIKDGKLENAQLEIGALAQLRRTRMLSSDFGHKKACEPVELESFADLSVEEYSKLVQDALTQADVGLKAQAIAEERHKRQSSELATDQALEQPPVGVARVTADAK